jgi:hypothetical protein
VPSSLATSTSAVAHPRRAGATSHLWRVASLPEVRWAGTSLLLFNGLRLLRSSVWRRAGAAAGSHR